LPEIDRPSRLGASADAEICPGIDETLPGGERGQSGEAAALIAKVPGSPDRRRGSGKGLRRENDDVAALLRIAR